ncbi:MAG: AMP-dependent synthetase [Candidatus Eisenbacteria bacterium]|uniref:AMP-dependent synthetase n=1 Tax=Eiseniibacteriota bacterium TaxID=2212470 RepID=A0A538SKP3_UNCEI|nr:MAG: AMP-dependent synthetase [Candidatus Eisenbacteria bacterium]
MPQVLRPRSRTLPDLLDEIAARDPAREFIVGGTERLSYEETRARVRQVAKGLLTLGVKRGDKVALLMPNRPEWLLIDFAVTLLGATLVPISTWSRARELAYMLDHSDATTLVTVERFAGQDYLGMLADLGGPGSERLPNLRRVVVVGCADAPVRCADAPVRFDEILNSSSTVKDAEIDAAQRTVGPDDVAYILYTSGTTSTPKGVQLRHGGLVENMWNIGERQHLTPADRMWMGISLFWSFGGANALLTVMTHGGSIVLQESFDAAAALELIERERCTVYYGTPNIALALTEHPDRTRRDLSSLRTGADKRLATVGTPLPGMEIRIVDRQTRRSSPPGEVGEILVRGHLTPGYYKDTERNAIAFDADGFLVTGDLGLIGDDGYLRFRGRIKEMVKSGGINVAPLEVEEVLLGHPAVEQAYVVGLPDPRREEILAAVVVLREGHDAEPEALRTFCKEALAAYKVPQQFCLLRRDELPVTDTGKVQKLRLAEMLAAKRGG